MINDNKLALVVEGGAMRGIFSTGVLDAFIEKEYQPFHMCVGVSAGATNIAAYLANMPKRNYKVYMTYSLDKRFISIWKFIKGGHLMDLDWLWGETIQHMRLDLDHIDAAKCDYIVGVTDAKKGEIVYKVPTKSNLEMLIKASSAVPILYRHPVIIEDNPYYDGGISSPIPIMEAVRRGAKKIVVLRSRKYEYRMKPSKNKLVKRFLKNYPEMMTAIEQRHIVYNNQMDFIRKTHQDIEIVEICPPDEFNTSRLTKNRRVLEKDYILGYEEGIKLMERLKNPLL